VPPPASAGLDSSILLLVIANALSLAMAYAEGWGALQLMLIYWGQGVIIGAVNVLRIVTLRNYSTEGWFNHARDWEDRRPPTPGSAALIFAGHYGVFVIGIGSFLAFHMATVHARLDARGFWICMLAFTVSHLWSFLRNFKRDRQGAPRLGDLMALPYLRVLPMHATILIGLVFLNSVGGLLLWGVLRTVADVAMHVVEHDRLRKSGGRA